MERTKIVLDADVIIHFSKGGVLSLLPKIFPEYDYIVLSIVYDEIKTVAKQLDNQIHYFKDITLQDFQPTNEMKREYIMLTSRFGRGESACMAYCRFTNNVIGSSNLKDITDYCNQYEITHLSTLDFLYYAYTKGLISLEEANGFIQEVISKGSHLPKISIDKYNCQVVL